MSTQTTVKNIQHWLMVIASSKADSSYINGIKLFMNDWDKKTPAEIERLCEQVKEVAVCEPAFAIAVFGKGVTTFFKGLDIERINHTS